jgi:hypothetical protein
MNADARARSTVFPSLLFLAAYQRLLVFISGPVRKKHRDMNGLPGVF